MILYIEEKIINHPRTQQICNFFPKAQKIIINHYKNIFDRKFPKNLSTEQWSPLTPLTKGGILVLAKLTGNAISQAPEWYGHAGEWWFFKTTLNCLFNCDYCYLKGAFKNDFPVVFVNYEDIGEQIKVKSVEVRVKNLCFSKWSPPTPLDKRGETIWWYMSDRSDTQGFDKMLGTHEYFFKLFDSMEGVMCETRTKSHDISTLISYAEQYGAPHHIEVAYSLNPQSLISAHEQGTASLDRRIENINTLLQLWYKVWLRFIPLLPVENYMQIYTEFLEYVVNRIDMSQIYSSFAGGLLYTKSDYKKIARKEPWFQSVLDQLHDAGDGFYREQLQVRQNFYGLFKKYVENCFVCLDEYK